MDKKDLLKEVTERYWDNYEPIDIDGSLKRYLEPQNELDGLSLLEAELTYACREGNITAEHCSTLVMMVGYSLEPLLQSVCVYRPEKIVLLLNKDGYDFPRGNKKWHVFARHFIKAVDLIVETGIEVQGERITQRPQFPGPDEKKRGYPVADSPEAVFQKLVEVLHDEDDVVIDVTGGKKSMTSGAYMYAAYAGARISYVDFDKYDPERRRPYGYSCKIQPLENPYQTFALREWEHVRDLYERYQFREAILVLTGKGEKDCENNSILPAMKKYLPDAVPDIEKLKQIFLCYESWDAGLYNEAAEKVGEIQQTIPDFTPPTAVTLLDGKWFATRQARFVGGLPDFYEDTPEFQAYVLDELERIQRLFGNEDYRSAFLRAGSLNEVMMLARLVRLVGNDEQRQELVNALQRRTPSAEAVFEHLKKPVGTSVSIGPPNCEGKRYDISFPGAPEITVIIQETMNWWRNVPLFDGQGSWRQFIHLRNDLAHKYYSPPRPWTYDALTFVRANVEDFWGKRVSEMGVQVDALPWPELCKLTGIHRFLPPNLRKEAIS